jgi:hypothetical protein
MSASPNQIYLKFIPKTVDRLASIASVDQAVKHVSCGDRFPSFQKLHATQATVLHGVQGWEKISRFNQTVERVRFHNNLGPRPW